MGLYADFAPGQLMAFLVSSQSYALGAACDLCAQRGFLREQVRPGSSRLVLLHAACPAGKPAASQWPS